LHGLKTFCTVERLYINDVVNVFKDNRCTCKLYADDLKMYSQIRVNDDIKILQNALDELYKWSNLWQLKISQKKCATLLIELATQSEESKNDVTLTLGSSVIAMCDEIKDLGITVSSKIGFSSYINNTVARAHARSNLIYKCFTSRDITTLVRAYLVYVRPLLEYATCIWSPQHITAVRQVESVQRHFTKRLPGLNNMNYDDRLAILGIEKLELRRLKQDLIMVYKILFGLVDIDAKEIFTVRNANHEMRGHPYRLLQGHCRVDVRKHSFAERVIKVWNGLPARQSDFCSLKRFVAFLDKVNLSKFLLFP
jgi:hypothetical protein